MTTNRPIPSSYWVVPDCLCAGEYPGAPTDSAARTKIARLRDSGITLFVDLTQERDGLEPYAHLLEAHGERPLAYRRFPIRDMDTPTAQIMRQILDVIDAALAAGECVYVHCWGGIGRTGTVVGCWLVEHGRSGQAALAEIDRLRVGIPDEWRASPETSAQRNMVLKWTTLSSTLPPDGARD